VQQNRVRDWEAECLGGLQVHHKLELRMCAARDRSENSPASDVRRNIMAATRTQGITVDTAGNFTTVKKD